jgi:hypothetical protein
MVSNGIPHNRSVSQQRFPANHSFSQDIEDFPERDWKLQVSETTITLMQVRRVP